MEKKKMKLSLLSNTLDNHIDIHYSKKNSVITNCESVNNDNL